MSKCRLKHCRSAVDPYEIYIEMFCVRDKFILKNFAYSRLWYLSKIDVGGMDIDHHVGAREVLNDAGCGVLCHGTVAASREYPVHIKIETRYASLKRIDAKRVERRIDVHDPFQFIGILLQDPGDFIADVLALELIAVGPRHYAESPESGQVAFLVIARRKNALLSDAELLFHRET